MHIKQIIIQGFKSYKDQTVIEPFSPYHNVVIGRNGSGKSNFFAAIRFVLSDAYLLLSREERQSLLHEGAGPSSMSAYVEIIFDNKDFRFPTGKDELIMRRTIGLKKDEYSMDGKAFSKSDVMNLLESAGFSRSNPYYIVPQGRITSLTHAKDHERLELLKEVAGTRVYEDRRQESLKIMKETEQKRSKIEELLKFIQDRLAELEEEKTELNSFHSKDKERRCLEYAIYSHEQKEILFTLSEMEEQRSKVLEGDNLRREDYYSRDSAITQLERDIREQQQSKELLEIEKRQILDERQERVKNQAQLKLTISDFETNPESNNSLKTQIQGELNLLKKEITKTNKELETLNPTLNTITNDSNALQERLDQEEDQRSALYAKQGHGIQFKSKKTRDQWLQSEITAISETVGTEKNTLAELENDLQASTVQLEDIKNDMDSINNKLQDQRKEGVSIATNLKTLKTGRDKLTDERKELWREDAKLDSTVQTCHEELRKCERTLASCMDQTTSAGLASVKKIAEELKLDGVYGPLYELFEVPEIFRTAVETTAGSRLFYVVVDTDETVSKLLTAMSQRKEGRITFMPLNCIRTRDFDYSKAPDAAPLINQLTFDTRFKPAFQQIFGGTVVCETLEIASTYARNLGFDAITLDGDRADRRGALMGGFYDSRRSKLECIESILTWKNKLDVELAKSKKIKRQITDKDQEVTKVLSDMQVAEAAKRKLFALREPMFAELSLKQQQETHIKELIAQKKRGLDNLRSSITKLESQVMAYRAELNTPFTTRLTEEEENLLQDLNLRVKETKTNLMQSIGRRSEIESRVNHLTSKLESNLERRRIDLSKQLETFTETDSSQSGQFLKSKRTELNKIEASIDSLSHRLQVINDKLDVSSEKIEGLSDQANKLKTDQARADREFEQQQRSFEQYLSQKALLIQKREACAKNIRELGVLPEEAFTKFVDYNTKQIMKRLHKVNSQLHKFSHVNKKAIEQYNSFSQQKDALLSRKVELDESEKTIHELIEVLDQCKDEAIARTFKQVATYFSEVFEKLVPAGQGKLVMIRSLDQIPQEDGQEQVSGSTENYVGISIKVSFNNKTDEGLQMQQLSGGQKSLVALTLIFAIQRCDPAPFYLFDEVDANLDAAHRSAVASMVHDLARNAQFITTTFRPELLARADQFYGVMFSNKVSRVSEISKDQATKFIELSTNN